MEEYEQFFAEIQKLKENEKKQLLRGLNDYNILTSVLKITDEVRLHTRMIFSLLNPKGDHGQESLFLELFIDSILPDIDFRINTDRCEVYKEFKNIDLYITDGIKHIIIENKIHAKDQKEQLKRYIDIIYKENEQVEYNDILVIYLSIDRIKPSEFSLGNYLIEKNNILHKNKNISLYKSIHYKKHIIKWLEICRHEIKNITNLNEAIKQYTEVVRMINGESKNKRNNIAEYINSNKQAYEYSVEVCKAMPEVRKLIITDFFERVVSDIKSKLSNDWVVELNETIPKKHNFKFQLYKSSWSDNNRLIFAFDFDADNYINGYFGVARNTEEFNVKDIMLKSFGNDIDIEISKIDLSTTPAWLHWEWLPDVKGSADFCEYITNKGNFADDFINTVLHQVDILEEKSRIISNINQFLTKHNK